MKRMILLVAIAAAIVAVPAWAFHDDGVAHCNGCHTMHNSQNGVAMNGTDADSSGNPINPELEPGYGYDDLLFFENSSDVCLRCHGRPTAGYSVWSADPRNPTAFSSAGDFSFLTEANLAESTRGAPVPGDAAGHNIASNIKGTDVDQTLEYAPGSNDTIQNAITCGSCHDPHGTYTFRILRQAGQDVTIGTNPTPVVYQGTIEAYGLRAGADPRIETDHNAYVSGYSAWCSTCHGLFHQGSGRDIHPSGESMEDVWQQYNLYMGTTDCVESDVSPCGTGDGSQAYLWQVPFEDSSFTEDDLDYTGGASANSRVACVSCHFAHASSAADSGRWDFNVTFLEEDGDAFGTYALPNPYDNNQRSLCNKCHGQDEFDALDVEF
jgi:hypothetical protein